MPAVAGTITVTGTASPDDAVVRGTLTVKNDANQPLPGAGGPAAGTIPATGPVTCSGGNWSLQFENVPPGNYIISVNEELPSEGAAAANLDVTAQIVISVTVAPGDITSATVDAVVTNNSGRELTVSAVAVQSPPKHGDKNHKRLPARTSVIFNFTGLTANKDVLISAFATNLPSTHKYAQGGVLKVKTKP